MKEKLFKRSSLGFEDYHNPTESMQEVAQADTSETPEAIEVSVTHDVEVLEEGITKVVELQDTTDALEGIAFALADALGSAQPLTPASAILMHNSMEQIASKLGYMPYIPSVEDFKKSNGRMHWTEVSFETVLQVWGTLQDAIYETMDIVVRGAIALSRKMTPLMNAKLKRAQELMNRVDGSHREAGLKEIAGNFVPALSIDGKIPEPKTVIQNCGLLKELSQEILSTRTSAQLAGAVKSQTRDFLAPLKSGDFGKPSLLYFLALVVFPSNEIVNYMRAEQMASRVTIPKNNQMDLTQLFPKSSKVNQKSADPRIRISKSEPLLGGRAVLVNDLNYGANTGTLTEIISMNPLASDSIGLSLVKDTSVTSGSIRTLTSSEQTQVLGLVIDLLTESKEYYGGELSRMNTRVNMNKEVFDSVKALYADRNFLNPNSRAAMMSMRIVMKYYTNLYWTGLVRGQLGFTRYISQLASALIQYVERSMSATQAERNR